MRPFAAALAALVLVPASGCFQTRYVAQQASGQWRLLRDRRRVADVLVDPRTPPDLRRRLTLASEAREFGVRVLGLRGGDGFTRFLDTGDRPIAWDVSAARKDKLEPLLIEFPIAGAVPYLGFFDEGDALAEKARLDRAGYDTYLRPVAGYSTLGMTADPIYSSMIDGSDASIVEVTLHEMLHGTVYLPGHSEWNESLATFVGVHGAAAFFARRGHAGDGERVLAEARRTEARQAAFAAFITPVVEELERLYAGGRPLPETLAAREAVFARARAEYEKRFPPPPGEPRHAGGFADSPLNNAVLVAWAVYHRAAPDHQRLFDALGGDLAKMVRLYKHAVDDDPDPLRYLHAWPGARRSPSSSQAARPSSRVDAAGSTRRREREPS